MAFPDFSVSYEFFPQIYQIYKVRLNCVIFQYGNVYKHFIKSS